MKIHDPFKRPRRHAIGLAIALSACLSVAAQGEAILAAYWDFNDTSNPNETLDKVYGFKGIIHGGAAFSAGYDGNAIDFGTTSEGQHVRVDGAPFLNDAAARDQITVSFWQNLHAVATTSAFWGVSPSSSSGERGIQVHTPWSNNRIYFDTAGCCDANYQRIDADVLALEPTFATGWHHLAFVKNKSTKQIWVNGQLLHEGINISPLPSDFTRLMIGSDGGAGNSLQGVMDDFAVFANALSPASIIQLADGTAPDQLPGVVILTDPMVSAVVGDLSGFTIAITDSLLNPTDPDSIEVELNNAPLDEVTISKVGNLTTVAYDSPTWMPSGSDNTVLLKVTDDNEVEFEFERTFTVRRYVVLEPDWKAPAGSWNVALPGYAGYLHQLPIARYPGDINRVWNAERQIAGGYIDPNTGQPFASVHYVDDPEFGGVQADGTFELPTNENPDPFFNWNQESGPGGTGAEVGSFTSATQPAPGYPDRLIPGIPGVGPEASNTDHIAMEAYTYVELEGGKLYTFVVNSDDGFRVTAGPEIRSVLTENWLGQFDGGKGASDVSFDVVAIESGVYRLRLSWWEGTGGANLEFFHLLDDGSKVMFNDPYNAQALKSYRPSATPQPFAPALVSVAPWPGQAIVGTADVAIELIFRNGTTATVPGASVEVRLNGAVLSTTVATVGDRVRVTTESIRPPGDFVPPGVHTVLINWSDSTGATYEDSYTFTVPDYVTLPEWLARDLGSGTNPGMTARVHQLDIGNNVRHNWWHVADQQLEGLFGANVATQPGPVNIDHVNMEQAADPNSGFFNAGNGYTVAGIPGIPGNTTEEGRNTDNIAMDVVTYIEFPNPGGYIMGVASDDGFRVIPRESWSRLPFRVESPASIAGYHGAVAHTFGILSCLPITPIVAEIVMVDPPLADGPLNNADQLPDKIALIERGAVAFQDKINRAREAGAVAVVMINSEDGEAANPMPAIMAIGDDLATFPAVMIRKAAGDAIRAALTEGPVTASLGRCAIPTLGAFDGGRGHGQTAFPFRVSKAGLYPFRLTWFEGEGGASVEWYMISVADGNVRALINHPNNVELGLRSFRNAPAVVEPVDILITDISIVNGKIRIEWDGVGTLQSTPIIPTAEWTDVTGTSPAEVDPPATGNVFFRVRE